MSVIASNSVNFVPTYQLLKTSTETKQKEISELKIEEKSNQTLDSISLSNFSKFEQSNPISSGALLNQQRLQKIRFCSKQPQQYFSKLIK